MAAIETSGSVGSVALAEGPRVVASRTFPAQLRHGVELVPALDDLCSQLGWEPASIRICMVSAGPGSFTGLRIGATVARMLAWSVGCRLVAVPSLDVLACNALELPRPPAHVAAVRDAKRGQVYAAIFRLDADCYRLLWGPRLLTAARLLDEAPRPLALLGEGIPHHPDLHEAPDVTILPESLWHAKAENVVKVGWPMAASGIFTPFREFVPLYIRPPEAEERWEQRHRRGEADSAKNC